VEVYFVTGNKHKFLEVEKLFREIGVSLKQLTVKLVEPQGDLEFVAEYKLKQAYGLVKKPVVVEDAGLFIEALNGFPGPYSRYVLETIGNEGILKLMEGVENRSAYFKAVVGYYDGRILKLFEGRVYGRIAYEKRGESGFGFDPIFIPEGYSQTFAENYELKKKISHRYRAFMKLIEWLKSEHAKQVK